MQMRELRVSDIDSVVNPIRVFVRGSGYVSLASRQKLTIV